MPTPAEGTTGQAAERHADKYIGIVAETTATRAVLSTDVDKLVICSNASATTCTIPESTSTEGKKFPIGSTITFLSTGAGGLTIAKTGSDTLTGTATAAQNIARRATKTAATVWHAYV
jgi:hypothetical protein